MNLQFARLRLALRSTPPAPVARTPAHEPLSAANDNQTVWPFVPFPPGWHASGCSAASDRNDAWKNATPHKRSIIAWRRPF